VQRRARFFDHTAICGIRPFWGRLHPPQRALHGVDLWHSIGMSETPGSPEYYTPPAQSVPTPAPPPSISDAAQQWSLAQDGKAHAAAYQAAPYQPAPASYPAAGPYAPPPSGPSTRQGIATTALVLGIIALLSGWIPTWGVVIGVTTIILAVVALAKKQSKGMAISGLVMGVVGAIESIAVIVAILVAANNVIDDDFYHMTLPPDYDDSPVTLGTVPSDGLYITEQAFGEEPGDQNVWWYVVYLENPQDVTLAPTEITVDALAADGTVLESSWAYQTVAPGNSAIVGNFWDIGDATVDAITVTGPGPDGSLASPFDGALIFSDPSVETDAYSTTVTGTVTSEVSANVYGGNVAIVARDEAGTIIGGATAYLQAIEPGESVAVDARFYYPLPSGVTLEYFTSSF